MIDHTSIIPGEHVARVYQPSSQAGLAAWRAAR